MGWQGFTPTLSDPVNAFIICEEGLNKFITTAPYVQFNNQHILVGNEVYVAPSFGPITLDAALKEPRQWQRLGGIFSSIFFNLSTI